MNYFESTVESRVRSRDDGRRQMVSLIRGWLREERHPRLTIVALLALSTVAALAAGCLLALIGVRGWGTRAFWAVLAAWPVFVGLVRWRAAVGFQQMALRKSGRDAYFTAIDKSAERESFNLAEPSETERTIWREVGRAHGQSMSGNILTLLFLGGLTLGCWLIWDLIQTGPTLLAETIFDAEVVPSRSELITTVTHRDWRWEAFGLTGIHFGGLAIAAGCVGWVLPYFALYSAR